MAEHCAHLHLHSAASFFDGLAPVEELVARAAELGQPGIGLTNHGNLYDAVPFYSACEKHGLKGVIGMEIYEAVPHRFDLEQHGAAFKQKWTPDSAPRYHHLTLWAADAQGWENLCAIHTQSFTAAYKPKNQPLVDRVTLESHSDGIIVGLGCMASRTSWAIANRTEDEAYQAATWYMNTFPGRVYMELMGNLPEQVALIHTQRRLAKRLGAPTLGTNDVHYVRQEDGVENGPHHALVQARAWRKKEGVEKEGDDKSDAGFGRWYGTDQFYLKSYADMRATSGLMPDDVHRTIEVLGRVDFDFSKLPAPKTPVAPVPGPRDDLMFDIWMDNYAA